MPYSKLSFVYDQLFELMKQENEGRQLHLDSKANTYIGLLSIAVTIFGTLGGLLTVENINLMKTLDFSLVATHVYNLSIDNYFIFNRRAIRVQRIPYRFPDDKYK